jgi:hypothetical protein
MKRAIAGAFLIAVVLFFCVLILIAKNVATIEDARASNAIREEFIIASTNMVANKQMKIISSPRHGSTRLFIYGDLSGKEEQTLQALAVQISEENSNRPVNIEFRKEISQGTNNLK